MTGVQTCALPILMFASKKGHVGAIKVLLENGADINKQEQRGFSV